MNAYEKYLTYPYGTSDSYEDKDERVARDIYYEATSILMDQELRKEVKSFMKPCTEAELLDAYCFYHELEKGEIFQGA